MKKSVKTSKDARGPGELPNCGSVVLGEEGKEQGGRVDGGRGGGGRQEHRLGEVLVG